MLTEALLVVVLRVLAVLLGGSLALLMGHALWLWGYRRWSVEPLALARGAVHRLLAAPAISEADLEELRSFSPAFRNRVVLELSRSLRGSARERLLEIAVALGVVSRAKSMLRSRFWWRRLRGTRVLALLGADSRMLFPLLNDPHPAVRAQAVEWAGEQPSPAMAAALLELLHDPSILCRFAVQDSLLRMGQLGVEPLVGYLSSHSGEDVLAALNVAVELAQPAFSSPAVALCRDAHPGVRRRAADLLGAIGGQEGTDALLVLLRDPDGEVRAAAAHALGRIGHWPAAPAVADLLRDPVWEVRRGSAMSLRELGNPGLLLLRRMQSDSNPFAADIARQVLQLPHSGGRARA